MRLLQRFLKAEEGSVLIITGAALLMLMGVAGAGIDLGRQQLVRSKLQQASDAASIAAATLPEGTTDAQRITTGERYFALNFPEVYMGVNRPAPSVSVSGTGISVSATTNLPTRFISFIGIDTVQTTGRSVVAKNVSTSQQDYDVVMVVDESGSTGASGASGQTRMEEEKHAIRQMVDNIFPESGIANPNLRLGLVGYTGYISNVGGLTSNRATALGYIDRLRPRCHNYDHYGLEAGLNMITGNWSAFNPVATTCPPAATVQRNVSVDPAATPRSDGKQLSDAKHIVFLTDGYIMVEPPACPGYPCYSAFLQQCNAIKAAGVTLYTISFASQTPGDANTLRQCASVDASGNPRYFFAPDGAALQQVLNSVGETIRKIRITE